MHKNIERSKKYNSTVAQNILPLSQPKCRKNEKELKSLTNVDKILKNVKNVE